jgi:hypothetical protein
VDESAAWLEQARSDREAGEALITNARAASPCHIVAKYQQCDEKAVKGVIVALREAGILHTEPGREHGVARHIKVLLRLPHAADNRAPQQHCADFSTKACATALPRSMRSPRAGRRRASHHDGTRNTRSSALMESGHFRPLSGCFPITRFIDFAG